MPIDDFCMPDCTTGTNAAAAAFKMSNLDLYVAINKNDSTFPSCNGALASTVAAFSPASAVNAIKDGNIDFGLSNL